MLIVLDNAGEQTRSGRCCPAPRLRVVVTSRDSMPGLIARDGARRMDLDPLPTARCGRAAARADRRPGRRRPAAAAALAALCSRLPLALRVAAELAAARSASSLADLVAELADQQRLLDLLDADRTRTPRSGPCSPGPTCTWTPAPPARSG